MAIFCLSRSLADLKKRLGNIVVGYSRSQDPIRARDLKADGAMAVLLKDALKPNLVQTLENNLAFVHGGPFANIAHGCNSILATSSAMKMADYVLTEAGFGADLGAEKFVDIKCRKSGLGPSLIVLVATVRALKYHGGVEKERLNEENPAALEKGIANLERHLYNIRNHYGLPCVVAINRFTHDTPAEFAQVKRNLAHCEVPVVVSDHFAQGGRGAEDLARAVVETLDAGVSGFRFVYEDQDSLWEKITKVATKIYGASEVVADSKIKGRIKQLGKEGYGHYPICIAKTQYSFSTDPQLRGAPSNQVLAIREVRLAAGAEFVVVVCGDMMTMPGLPEVPAAHSIDLDERGRIVGLF